MFVQSIRAWRGILAATALVTALPLVATGTAEARSLRGGEGRRHHRGRHSGR